MYFVAVWVGHDAGARRSLSPRVPLEVALSASDTDQFYDAEG